MELSVNYMGLKLRNPIIVGSSGLSKNIEGIRKLYENGAGAIILKSLFEEQIMADSSKTLSHEQCAHTEAYDYVQNYTKDNTVDDYLDLISKAKEVTTIPIIASINCITDSEWISFAKKIQIAGADALELNISFLPSDDERSSEQNEKIYFSIIEKIKEHIDIPIALKMSHYSSGLANLIKRLSWTQKVDSFTLFNKFYSPDINIDTLEIHSAGTFSTPEDISMSLRWIALLSDKIQTQLVPSTGIFDGDGVIKQLLAGATAVQTVSTIYKNGAEQIGKMLDELKSWMEENGYESIEDFRGAIHNKKSNSQYFERIQFMKYYSGIE